MRSFAFGLVAHLHMVVAFAVADDETPAVPRPEPAKWIEVKAEKDGVVWLKVPTEKSEWELIDRANGASLDVPPGSTVAVFRADPSKPSGYRVVATSGDKLLRYMIVVGEGPFVPPGPPVPPVPPKPVDELTKQLQAAYASDTGTTKAADLRQLIGLYVEAASFAKDVQFATAADLFAAVSAAAGQLLPDVDGNRRLAGLRKVLAGELVKVIPTDPDAPLTDDVRAAASAAFTKYATALKGVTP